MKNKGEKTMSHVN